MFDTISRYADYLEKANLFSYPVSLFLGFLAGMAAITCFLPIIPVVMGFMGGQKITRQRLLLVPLFIMLGSIIILAILGIIVSVAGLTLQRSIGPYWYYFIGSVCLFVGLLELGIIKLPKLNLPQLKYKGFWAPLLFGLVVGGTIGIGSSCCLPALPIVLTYAGIQGKPVHGALILSTFAIGQSIPIFAIGLFSGALGKATAKWSFYVQRVAGVLLLVLGIYFIIWGGKLS